MNQTRCLLALTMCVLLTSAVRICTAATFTCGTSDVACLIAAIHAANSTLEPDMIRLAVGTYLLTTVDNTTDGMNALPSITSPITLEGAGMDATIVERVETAPAFRLLHVAATGALTVRGLTLAGGDTYNAPSRQGGGILNRGTLVLTAARLEDHFSDEGGGLANVGGQMTIERSELVGNVAAHPGGGIYTEGGTVTIRQSTLADNHADGGTAISNNAGTVLVTDSAIVDNTARFFATGISTNGVLYMTNTTMARNRNGDTLGPAGALTVYGGEAILTNSTIVDNTTALGGAPGGILRVGGTVVLRNTIVARNTSQRGPQDCSGLITSEGHNLIGDPTGCAVMWQPTDLTGDPGLDAYLDDGQPGHGHYPLLATSRAVDAGNPFTCPTTDQLGRPRSGPCDLGSIEFQPVLPPALTLTLNQSRFVAGETVRVALRVQQPGPTVTGDFYFGAILPDGQTALFISNEGWVQARLDDPHAFRPLAKQAVLSQGLDLAFDPFFAYTFQGAEASGIYSFFALFTPPEAFSDGRIDAGDLLALELKSFRFSPSGLVAQLPANIQAIRDRHMNR